MSDNNFSFPFQFPLPSSASHQNDQSTADLSNYLVTNTGVENAFSSPTPAQLLNEVADMEYRGLSMLDHERTIGSYPEDPNMEKYQYGYGYPYGYGLDDKKDDEMPRYIDPNALTCAPGSVFESTIEDENQSANFTSNINNNISTLPSSSSNALLFPVMKVPVQNAAGVNTPRSILLPIPTRSGLSSPTYPHQQGISGQNSNPSLSSPYTYQTSSPLSSLLQPQSPTNASSLSSLSSPQHLYTNHKGVRFVLNQNENEMKTALGSPISPRLLSLGLRAGVPGRGLMGWEGPDDYVDISTNHPSTNTAAVAPENKQGVSTRTQKKRGRDDNSDIDDKSDTGAPVNRGSTKRVRMQINSTDDADAGDGTKRLWVSPRKTRGTVARYALTSEGGKSQENEESDHSEDEDEDEAISDSGSDSDVYQPSRSPSPISSDFGENSVGHGIPSSSSIPELRGRGKTHASSTTQRKAGTGTGTTRRKKGKATGSAANALATILKMKAESTGQNVSEVGPMDGSSGYSSADPEHNGDSTGSMMRRRKNSHIPLPVPIPNLIKKSRGRKVPYVVPTAGNSGETRRRSRTASTSASPHKSKVDTGEEERMYICDVPGCGKCFVRGEHLKRHIRSLHTYDKPYPCPYDGCDKSFSRRDNLGQHVRVHLQ